MKSMMLGVAACVAALAAGPAASLEFVAGYNPADTKVGEPGSLSEQFDVTGILVSRRNGAMITPMHAVQVRHDASRPSRDRLAAVGQDGVRREYDIARRDDVWYTAPDGRLVQADIAILTLTEPIPAEHVVTFYPIIPENQTVYDRGDDPDDRIVYMFGRHPDCSDPPCLNPNPSPGAPFAVGTNRLGRVEFGPIRPLFSTNFQTHEAVYDTDFPGSPPQAGGTTYEAAATLWDSGCATFVIENGRLALVGLINAGGRFGLPTRATFLPRFIDEINQILALDGYELTTDAACPADVDRNGTADVLDLITFLSAYADTQPDRVTEDVNGDGLVDVFDLVDFLTVFSTRCGSDGP